MILTNLPSGGDAWGCRVSFDLSSGAGAESPGVFHASEYRLRISRAAHRASWLWYDRRGPSRAHSTRVRFDMHRRWFSHAFPLPPLPPWNSHSSWQRKVDACESANVRVNGCARCVRSRRVSPRPAFDEGYRSAVPRRERPPAADRHSAWRRTGSRNVYCVRKASGSSEPPIITTSPWILRVDYVHIEPVIKSLINRCHPVWIHCESLAWRARGVSRVSPSFAACWTIWLNCSIARAILKRIR